MDTATFLARVVAPGNFLAVCYKGPGKPMGTKFFPRTNLDDAVGFVQWADRKQMDVWYSPASYRIAEVKGENSFGKPNYKGERNQNNADQLQCFWYDADIKRDGDGKDPSRCFSNLDEVDKWVATLQGMPKPNLWVRSGWGVHLYWVLEEPLPRLEWQILAEYFKAGLLVNKAIGDIGISGNAACLLRPPNTRNYKVPDLPQLVSVVRNDL